jgi:hypothetical protein
MHYSLLNNDDCITRGYQFKETYFSNASKTHQWNMVVNYLIVISIKFYSKNKKLEHDKRTDLRWNEMSLREQKEKFQLEFFFEMHCAYY